MSDVYRVVCDICRQEHSLCVYGPASSFGISSNDESGRASALRFIEEHTGHYDEHGIPSSDSPSLRILHPDAVPGDYEDMYPREGD